MHETRRPIWKCPLAGKYEICRQQQAAAVGKALDAVERGERGRMAGGKWGSPDWLPSSGATCAVEWRGMMNVLIKLESQSVWATRRRSPKIFPPKALFRATGAPVGSCWPLHHLPATPQPPANQPPKRPHSLFTFPIQEATRINIHCEFPP